MMPLMPGVGCVAAPVWNHTSTVKYGISVSTQTLEHTFRQIDAMAPLVVETAENISAALGYCA